VVFDVLGPSAPPGGHQRCGHAAIGSYQGRPHSSRWGRAWGRDDRRRSRGSDGTRPYALKKGRTLRRRCVVDRSGRVWGSQKWRRAVKKVVRPAAALKPIMSCSAAATARNSKMPKCARLGSTTTFAFLGGLGRFPHLAQAASGVSPPSRSGPDPPPTPPGDVAALDRCR